MISDNIRELRKRRGMSQRELAALLGISNKTISRWETGEGDPDIGYIVPMAQIFGVSTDEILIAVKAEIPEEYAQRKDPGRMLQDAMTYLQEKNGIKISRILSAAGIREYELQGIISGMKEPDGENFEKKAVLTKIVIILRDLIPRYVDNPDMLVNDMFSRLCDECGISRRTVGSFAGLSGEEPDAYLLGKKALTPKLKISLLITLFMLDRAFNRDEPFPWD